MTIWNELSGFETTFIDAGGTRTRIVSSHRDHIVRPDGPGSRPTLWLHGRGGHLETFRYNLPTLARTRSTVAVDLLGHGLTAATGAAYSVDELADHISAVVAVLDDGRGFDLVGQSLGAWAGLLATLNGAPIHRIALIEPAGMQGNAERMADQRVKAAFDKGGQAFDEPTTETVRLRFAQLLHNPDSCDDEMVELRRRLYNLPGATQVHRAVRAADNEAFVIGAHHLEALGRPVAMIRGEHGHIPMKTYESSAAAATGSTIHTIRDAKQWPHYEQPGSVNRIILNHFER